VIPGPPNKSNNWSVLFALLFPLGLGAWYCWAFWELSPWLSGLAVGIALIVADQLVGRCFREMAFYREIERARREWESFEKTPPTPSRATCAHSCESAATAPKARSAGSLANSKSKLHPDSYPRLTLRAPRPTEPAEAVRVTPIVALAPLQQQPLQATSIPAPPMPDSFANWP